MLRHVWARRGWRTRGRRGEEAPEWRAFAQLHHQCGLWGRGQPGHPDQGPVLGAGEAALSSPSHQCSRVGPGTYKMCSWCPGLGLEEATA